MSREIDNQSVPVSELENLFDTLDKIKCITVRERNILWTCQEGLLSLIRDYKRDKEVEDSFVEDSMELCKFLRLFIY